MKKELQELEEGPEANVHLNSLRATLKKIPNWKTPGHDSIHGFWFKNFKCIHDRWTLPTRSKHTQIGDKGANYPNAEE